MRALVTARHVTIALAGILIGIVLGGGAYAVSGAAFRYSTPQTGYLMIPAAAFATDSSNTIYVNNGAAITASSSGCFSAPVNLPHGAKMTQLAIWYAKDDTAATLNVLLIRQPPLDGHIETVAEIHAAPTAGEIKLAAVNIANASLQTVNNARYAYYFLQCISPEETFFSARVRYTYKTAGD